MNYQPSRTGEGFKDDPEYKYGQYELNGTTQQIPIEKTQNFKQAGELYRSFSAENQVHLIEAIGYDLKKVKSYEIRSIVVSYLYKADKDYGRRVARIADVKLNDAKRLADSYTD